MYKSQFLFPTFCHQAFHNVKTCFWRMQLKITSSRPTRSMNIMWRKPGCIPAFFTVWLLATSAHQQWCSSFNSAKRKGFFVLLSEHWSGFQFYCKCWNTRVSNYDYVTPCTPLHRLVRFNCVILLCPYLLQLWMEKWHHPPHISMNQPLIIQ